MRARLLCMRLHWRLVCIHLCMRMRMRMRLRMHLRMRMRLRLCVRIRWGFGAPLELESSFDFGSRARESSRQGLSVQMSSFKRSQRHE